MVLEDLFGAKKMFNLALSSYVPVLAFFFLSSNKCLGFEFTLGFCFTGV